MSAGMLFVLWKGFMGFAIPIALGLWELHRLRRWRDQDRAELARRDAPPDPPPVPAAPAAPVRQRTRELEPV
jgi:cytochrome oxidase assembly protein ShyY1